MGILVIAPVPVSALVVTSVTPASGSSSGGNLVTIKGSGFMRTKNETFTDIAAGVEHALMLSSTGHVWVVGDNKYGQLGVGQITSAVVTPRDITDDLNLDSDDFVTRVICGDYHSIVITNNHRVIAWGYNDKGQVGSGLLADSYKPVDITNNFELAIGEYIVDIAVGAAANYGITNTGKVYFWGDTEYQQTGEVGKPSDDHITPAPQTKPKLIEHLGDNNRYISAGNKSAISLTNTHSVATWGSNMSGELGRVNYKQESPDKVLNYTSDSVGISSIDNNIDLVEDDEVTDVEAGNGVMAVLTKLHRVYIWGDDRTGMLGLMGEKPNPDDEATGNDLTSVPVDITDNFDGLADDDCIAEISIGNSHVLALSQYGEVFSWGEGDYGQLGDGMEDGDPVDTPTNITANFDLPDDALITKVIAAGAGDPLIASYSYALDSDGNVYAWGGSAKHTPGINSIANNPTPTTISDRLSVDVPDVATISFGDEPVMEFDVIGDETIQLLTPATLGIGEVSVTLTDSTGTTVEAIQKYTYTQATTDLLPDDNDESDDSIDTGDDNISDGNSAGNSDNQDDASDNNDSDEGSGDDDTDDGVSSSNIAAPNTGWVAI